MEPVKSSDWATPLVLVPNTNGRLRKCGDYKVTMTQCVEKKVCPLLTTEDLFVQTAEDGSFQNQICRKHISNEYSKNLLVGNTPKELFRYTWPPYGVSTATAIFQSVMDRILHGLPACYLDDILIATKAKVEHDQLLEQTL